MCAPCFSWSSTFPPPFGVPSPASMQGGPPRKAGGHLACQGNTQTFCHHYACLYQLHACFPQWHNRKRAALQQPSSLQARLLPRDAVSCFAQQTSSTLGPSSHRLHSQEASSFPFLLLLEKNHTCVDARRPAWMNKELLTKPRHKKEAYQRWKQGQAIWRNTGTLTEHAERGKQWIF